MTAHTFTTATPEGRAVLEIATHTALAFDTTLSNDGDTWTLSAPAYSLSSGQQLLWDLVGSILSGPLYGIAATCDQESRAGVLGAVGVLLGSEAAVR